MYSQSAGSPQQIMIESKRGGAYKPREHHFRLHDFEQEYTAKEREEIQDAYADGYAFAESGGKYNDIKKHLTKKQEYGILLPKNGMKMISGYNGRCAKDNIRLFRLGFKDFKEAKHGKAV